MEGRKVLLTFEGGGGEEEREAFSSEIERTWRQKFFPQLQRLNIRKFTVLISLIEQGKKNCCHAGTFSATVEFFRL